VSYRFISGIKNGLLWLLSFFHLLLFQGTWSYHWLQTPGIFWTLFPLWWRWGGREIPDQERWKMEVPLSTHPLFTPYLMGKGAGVWRKEPSWLPLRHLFLLWMGSLGAFGDILYYRGFLPLFSGISTLLLLLSPFLFLLFWIFTLLLEGGIRIGIFLYGYFTFQIPVDQDIRRVRLPFLRDFLPLVSYPVIFVAFLWYGFFLYRTEPVSFLVFPLLFLGAIFCARFPFRGLSFFLLIFLVFLLQWWEKGYHD